MGRRRAGGKGALEWDPPMVREGERAGQCERVRRESGGRCGHLRRNEHNDVSRRDRRKACFRPRRNRAKLEENEAKNGWDCRIISCFSTGQNNASTYEKK
ncbi:hypothetical protein PRIPAC_76546 [Pristionchus pacificus]|nr:hypothetical protein PRIPAC_76546 [Pristionchus pacificus]|eukprot:PDM80602.1 hypothetical protein PRIPAC_35605 [Pristionchus pacificus]